MRWKTLTWICGKCRQNNKCTKFYQNRSGLEAIAKNIFEIFVTSGNSSYKLVGALCRLFCADVPLRNCWLAHSLTYFYGTSLSQHPLFSWTCCLPEYYTVTLADDQSKCVTPILVNWQTPWQVRRGVRSAKHCAIWLVQCFLPWLPMRLYTVSQKKFPPLNSL